MNLAEMLTMIALWCQDTGFKAECQNRMSRCVQVELKKMEADFSPILLRCWDKMDKTPSNNRKH